MMGEKRFTFYYERGNEVVIEENGKRISNKKVVDLLNELYDENDELKQQLKTKYIVNKQYEELQKLKKQCNEQQATINELEDENHKYHFNLSLAETKVKNREKKIDEQQATITELEKNFEDLVNWSTEIAKRNVVLDEQIGELQRENEQLRKELNDCEKFRYTVFKRLNDEYIKERSIK